MVMLGNQVELWESMLAVMKLGAVIIPATTALGPRDLADRVGRGAVRHVITNADEVAVSGFPAATGSNQSRAQLKRCLMSFQWNAATAAAKSSRCRTSTSRRAR
jgi:acyl-coenzyme A synthetase/AMP-(fatty) acid ligase